MLSISHINRKALSLTMGQRSECRTVILRFHVANGCEETRSSDWVSLLSSCVRWEMDVIHFGACNIFRGNWSLGGHKHGIKTVHPLDSHVYILSCHPQGSEWWRRCKERLGSEEGWERILHSCLLICLWSQRGAVWRDTGEIEKAAGMAISMKPRRWKWTGPRHCLINYIQ